jgi:uncharacterized protein
MRAADAVDRGTRRDLQVPFALAPDGAQSWFPLSVVRGREDGPTRAVTAGIHGDEYEGPRAVHDLLASIDPTGLRGTVLAVPVAHLAAFAAASRTSPIDGVNLARVFPGDPEGTVTVRLADALFREVVAGADLLVDLHSGGVRLAFAAVAGFYGTADAAARALAMPYLWRLPERAGVLSFEAHRRGIAVAGCEAGGRGGCLDEDRLRYRDGLLRLMRVRGMLPGEPGSAPAYETVLDGDWQLAPAGGLLANHVGVGDRVDRGALLATIRDPFGATLAEMTAPYAGFVLGTRHLCAVQPGEWATCVVREVPR